MISLADCDVNQPSCRFLKDTLRLKRFSITKESNLEPTDVDRKEGVIASKTSKPVVEATKKIYSLPKVFFCFSIVFLIMITFLYVLSISKCHKVFWHLQSNHHLQLLKFFSGLGCVYQCI